MTPLDGLRTTNKILPADLRDEILALGSDAVAALIEILKDEQLGAHDSPAGGWPPIHAVDLLVDLNATEAIEPMLDLLLETDSMTIIHDRILLRLHELGAAVLEPAFDRLEKADDEEDEATLLAILAQLGVKDERIYETICDVFERNVDLGALYFGQYGDSKALPLIEEEIFAFEPDFSHPFWRMDLNELLDCHERLGGVLGDELVEHVEAVDGAWARHVAQSAKGTTVKIGRNDPCPCGSGKKFKKCCIDKPPA